MSFAGAPLWPSKVESGHHHQPPKETEDNEIPPNYKIKWTLSSQKCWPHVQNKHNGSFKGQVGIFPDLSGFLVKAFSHGLP